MFMAISEVARNVARYWGGSPADIPEKYKSKFQWEILMEQIEAEQIGGNYFISDRTSYDNLAYMNSNFWKHKNLGSRSVMFANDLDGIQAQEDYYRYKRLAQASGRYDIVFLVPKAWELEDDGVRHKESKFQDMMQKEIFEIVKNSVASSRIHVLQSKTTAERTVEAKNIILDRLKLVPNVLIEEPF
jgi:nicotinamide riboside kinase